jgi:Terminase large subunit, T4likevirus-type, N-terminal
MTLSEILRNRARLLLGAKSNRDAQLALNELCKRDFCYWVDNFVMTFNPRLQGADCHIPMVLYPFQANGAKLILESMGRGEDLLIEKSRDMGASWLIVAIFTWCWLFEDGVKFHIGSRKEDLVDKIGDMDTLIEKVRYILRWLPPWMLPDGFKASQHASFMRIINPANGNAITGESSNAGFARGGRSKAILFDEFAFWDNDNSAWVSAGHSTNTRIAISTPNGKANTFAKIALDYGNPNIERVNVTNEPVEYADKSRKMRILRFHWTNHPDKNQEWYDYQCRKESPDAVAREIDINYNLSVGNVVFKGFNPVLHVDETPLEKILAKFTSEEKLIRAFDFGRTCCVLFSTMDTMGRLYVFKEIVLVNTGGTPTLAKVAKQYSDGLTFGTSKDTCDPSGVTKNYNDEEAPTAISILENHGFNPVFTHIGTVHKRLVNGVELLQSLLSQMIDGQPMIKINAQGCPTLIDAFQSGYAYRVDSNGNVLDEINENHPYEDVMDCLRYQAMQFMGVSTKPIKRVGTIKPWQR